MTIYLFLIIFMNDEYVGDLFSEYNVQKSRPLGQILTMKKQRHRL